MWVNNGKRKWLRIAIVAFVSYLIFSLVVILYFLRLTQFRNAKLRIDNSHLIQNVYTDMSWNKYQRSILELNRCYSDPLVMAGELDKAISNVDEAKGGLVVDDKLSIELPYKDILRHPDEYRGKVVHFEGKVLDKFDSSFGKYVFIVRLSNTKNNLVYLTIGSYDRTKDNIKEGDVIEVFGISDGIHEASNTSTIGAMPYVAVENIANLTNLSER